ncbi:MAG: undecaprenyldiphospho-muramoylpentapeptide beta-N-acetylglucosaminyltransferase [Desulfovibrionaceae bacterium]
MDRVVLTTGGTGGHIFPALAVAGELRRRHPGCRVLFVGGRGPEKRLATEAGLEFEGLHVSGVLGRGWRGALSLLGMGVSVLRSGGLLSRFRPQVVAGFGGFAGFCPVLAARLLRIPALIHEQNSVPGAANRFLSRKVDRVLVSFPDTAEFFPGRNVLAVGNPVRPDIAAAGRARAGRAPGRRLLVLGGSQGARALNDLVVAALPRLRDLGVEIFHQAGAADEARVREAYRAAGFDDSGVHGFVTDMAGAYADADLALCRAGASTVFELAAAGLPALLVPFPHATHDHQTRNARALETAGAARCLPQAELTAEGLGEQVAARLADPAGLAAMSRAALGFARPSAAADIVDQLESLARPRAEEN